MKIVKGLILVAAAAFTLASCDKTPISDAQVGFTSEVQKFYMEDGPNFDIPVTISGDNITYPVTLKITHDEGTGILLPERQFNERNLDWRFLDRELVINSPEDKPVVTVRQIADVDTLYVGVKLEVISNCTVVGNATAEALIMPAANYYYGDWTMSYTSAMDNKAYDDKLTYTVDPELGEVMWGLFGMTVENTLYPLPVEGVIMDYGEELGKLFTIAMPFDASEFIGAANLSLNADDPNEKTLCILCPILVQGQSLYLDTAYLGAVSEDQFMLTIPKYDPESSVEPCLAAGFFNYQTGAFVDVFDIIDVDDITRGFAATKSALQNDKTIEFIPFTGELEKIKCYL